MKVYLIRHGDAVSSGVDPRRPLSEEGRAEVRKISSFIRPLGICVEHIWHSGKTRASQTAEIFAASLNPGAGVKSRDAIGPLDDVESLAGNLPKDRNEMIVGHLPFMERIVSYLVAGDPDGRVVVFQNGGVVRLDWDAEGQRWVIGSTVFPY